MYPRKVFFSGGKRKDALPLYFLFNFYGGYMKKAKTKGKKERVFGISQRLLCVTLPAIAITMILIISFLASQAVSAITELSSEALVQESTAAANELGRSMTKLTAQMDAALDAIEMSRTRNIFEINKILN